MKIITSLETLMKYARDLGEARLSGDAERIKIAQERHDAYRDICLRSDEIHTGLKVSDLG